MDSKESRAQLWVTVTWRALRLPHFSPSRFHAWSRRHAACKLDDHPSCLRASPHRYAPPDGVAAETAATPCIPAGFRSLTPYVIVAGADRFIGFVEQVFGAAMLELSDGGESWPARPAATTSTCPTPTRSTRERWRRAAARCSRLVERHIGPRSPLHHAQPTRITREERHCVVAVPVDILPWPGPRGR